MEKSKFERTPDLVADAKTAYGDYLNGVAGAEYEIMSDAETSLKKILEKLNPSDRKRFDDYINTLPESERPQHIALDI